MNNLKQVLASLGMATFMLLGGNAFADVVLHPGDTFTSGFAGTTDPDTDLTALLNFESNTFLSTPSGKFSGTVGSWVFTTTANPYGAADLAFAYSFTAGPGLDGIERMTIGGFENFATTVYTTTCCATGAQVPISVDRNYSGVLGVSFNTASGGVKNGNWSGGFVIYTDATAYGQNYASFIDGGIGQAQVFAPVPEPETYAMMLAGLGLMGFIARRRKQGAAA